MSPAPVHARHVLIATQAVFFVCVLLCVLIAHGTQAEIYGISYYGVHAPTLPLVVIGYGVGALGLWRTSTYLAPLATPAMFIFAMRAVAIALPVLLLLPWNHGTFFNWAHMCVGIVIGVAQMSLGTYLMFRQRQSATTFAVVVQLLGGIIAALSLPDWGFNHMLEGELLFELGFSWCLVRWTGAAANFAPRFDVVESDSN